MFTWLVSIFLLSVDALHVRAQSRTYRATDPTTGGALECDRCPPGTYLRESCTSTRKTQCAACPSGSFTELWNYIPKCLRCGECGHNQVVKTACAPDADCTCQCTEGFYYRESYDMCVPFSKCPAGEGVLIKGTPGNDTVCQVCPAGSFSDTNSAHHTCILHKSCDAAGLKLLLKGSTWHNSICADIEHLKDGAEYLKEILPAFFLHHNRSPKRLRRVLHKLPGYKPTDCLGQSAAERINAWVASATGSQIQQLPDILSTAGIDQNGERLHNKLQRINSSLKEFSSLKFEADVSSFIL